MSKYKLVVADLDGTLLDDTYTVRPELVSAIDRVRSRGAELVVATGRLYPSALPFAEDLGVTLPIIASNGAIIKDPGSGELLYHLPLPRHLAIEALRIAKSASAQRFVNIKDTFYTDAPEESTKKYSEALRVNFIRRSPLEDVVTEDPTMVVVRDREAEISRMTRMLRDYFGNRVYMANSKPFFIDINHPGVSKGFALSDICKRMGIDRCEVIAVGDGWNDLEMFKAAGIGAAVANAPQELKAKADFVCKNATYKGVIEVLEQFIF